MKQKIMLAMVSTLALVATSSSGYCGGLGQVYINPPLLNAYIVGDGIDHASEDSEMMSRSGVTKAAAPCTGKYCVQFYKVTPVVGVNANSLVLKQYTPPPLVQIGQVNGPGFGH